MRKHVPLMHTTHPELQRVSLASLTGTWRRRWIRWSDGREDAATAVWWVQAGRYYGDLRLPADPSLAPEGFAGELKESGGIFHWARDIDLRPTGRPDVGLLRYTDDRRLAMIEEGVEEPYTELWERAGDAWAPLALRSTSGALRGWFVGTGDRFILATQSDSGAIQVSYGRRDDEGRNGTVIASSAKGREGMRAFDNPPAADGWVSLDV